MYLHVRKCISAVKLAFSGCTVMHSRFIHSLSMCCNTFKIEFCHVILCSGEVDTLEQSGALTRIFERPVAFVGMPDDRTLPDGK